FGSAMELALAPLVHGALDFCLAFFRAPRLGGHYLPRRRFAILPPRPVSLDAFDGADGDRAPGPVVADGGPGRPGDFGGLPPRFAMSRFSSLWRGRQMRHQIDELEQPFLDADQSLGSFLAPGELIGRIDPWLGIIDRHQRLPPTSMPGYLRRTLLFIV